MVQKQVIGIHSSVQIEQNPFSLWKKKIQNNKEGGKKTWGDQEKCTQHSRSYRMHKDTQNTWGGYLKKKKGINIY